MKILIWDSGIKWGDPNARWGSPSSYLLEPGDAGYAIPPGSATHSNQPRKHIMSLNKTPVSRVILLHLARAMRAGLASPTGLAVGTHHHTAASLLPLILALDGDPGAAAGSAENKGSQLVYRDCIDATGDAQEALLTLSDGAVKEWLEGYKKVMEQVHGRKAGDGWAAAGFPEGRPSVPRNHAARHALLSAARAYLAAHAGYETSLPRKDLPALDVSAAQALALHTQMQNAQALIDSRQGEQALCKQARDADVDELYDEVSGAIAELHDLLPDTDARWEIFGLNIPANPTPPLAVASLTLSPAGAGRLLAEWPYAVRAEYYRVFLKTTGSPDPAVNIADPKDLEYTLKGLAPGTTVEVQVIPMNDAGAGPGSPVVTALVP